MSLAVDEYGRPFIIMREQHKQRRLTGHAAIKSNLLAARSVANTLKTSFGPKGMDKIIVSQDGDVTVTNDGAEILDKMDIAHEVGQLLVELSKAQDDEIGDGTTGVVILAGALLGEALPLLEKGIHPLQISKGFDKACKEAVAHLETISAAVESPSADRSKLVKTAKTTLCSKFVNNYKDHLAEICVDAVLRVANFDRKDVNFEMLRIEGKPGSTLNESLLVDGIIIDKAMSHSQMKKTFEQPKIALLTCAFEPPKPKTKHFVEIESVEQYNQLYEQEQQAFREMVRMCKDSGADIIFCQWGFDDEANHLLLKNEMPAVRWVGGAEMESLAIATGAKIVARFEDLNPSKLGTAGQVREVGFGNSNEKMIFVEKCPNTQTVTILLRAGNKMAVDEAKRSVHDALCVVRNLVKDPRVCYGGGSCELSCSLKILEKASTVKGLKQYGYMAFGLALEAIPMALAENAGFDAIKTVAELKQQQKTLGNPFLGVNVREKGGSDMKKRGVFETFLGKRQQLQLATQMAKIILKTDDVIKTEELDYE